MNNPPITFSSLKRSIALAASALLLGLVIAGCGSAVKQQSGPPGVRFNGRTASLQLTSQFSGAALPALYTCVGRDVPPPFVWGTMPPGTKQLVLFILGFQRSTQRTAIKVRYAAAGLNPALHGVQTGELPHRSIAGRNSAGKTKYSLCPAKGTAETYAFFLYALPKQGGIRRGFNSALLLRQLGSHTGPPFGALVTAFARP